MPELLYDRSAIKAKALTNSGGLFNQSSDHVSSASAKATRSPASRSHSHAIGEGLCNHALNTPASFRIFASDARGRSLLTGGDAFAVSIRGPNRVNHTLLDNENGSYAVKYLATGTFAYIYAVSNAIKLVLQQC